MDGFSQDNILIQTASAAKKGGGVNAVLSLLQDLIAFRDKVESAMEAQDLGENKQKLEVFHDRLGEMYESLLDIARGGIKSVRENSSEEVETRGKNPIMMNDNTIQSIP